MIITDKEHLFGVTWEVMEIADTWVYGPINFIIDYEVVPKSYPFNYKIETVFYNLQNSFWNKIYLENSEGELGELGDRKINYTKLDFGEELNIFEIETTEMGDKTDDNCRVGCTHMWLGYDGNEERLIYSTDFGQTYREIRLPRNTVETVIMSLPTNTELLENGVTTKHSQLKNNP